MSHHVHILTVNLFFVRFLSPRNTFTWSPLESFSCSSSSLLLSSSLLPCCSIGDDNFVKNSDRMKCTNQNILFDRFGTISHILASTELNCCSKKEDVLSNEELIEKNAVEIVKQMQRLRGIDGDYDSDSAASNRLAQRKTIQNLERNRTNKKRAIGTLDVAFKKRFFALSGEDEAPLMDNQKQSSRKFLFA